MCLELPEPKERWISMSSHTPWYYGTYTVWRSGEVERKADRSNKGWSDPETGDKLDFITHWCPMPEKEI